MKLIRKIISRILIITFIVTNVLSAYTGVIFASSGKIGPIIPKPEKIIRKDREKFEIIVKYEDDSIADMQEDPLGGDKDGVSADSSAAEIAGSIMRSVKGRLNLKKLELKSRLSKNKLDVLEIDKLDDINKVISELKKDKRVKYVQPNYPLQTNDAPADGLFGKQWGLLNDGQSVEGLTGRSGVDINAINAWNITQGNDSVVVGILDTGIDITHPELINSIVPGWDFVNNDDSVYDDPELDLHGTQVAGIIAADANSIGIRGVAPDVKIMPLKFINGSVGYTSDAIDAINYAMEHGVQIINCSFGGSDNNFALKDAMENSGILFVCSAGNRGADTSVSPVYPACFDIPNVLSVAAVDSNGVLADFSGYGSAIDVAAPGVCILTIAPGNGESLFDYMSGTSASTAFVSGIAALSKSYLPDLTIMQLADRIRQNVVPCTILQDKLSSGGRVDAYASLTNTIPEPDDYIGSGNDDYTVPPSIEDGDIDSWYTTDQLAKIKERIHYGESGVNPGSGNFSFTVNDMSVSAPGFIVNISRSYNSKDNKSAPFGRGWTFGFEGSAKGSDLVTVILPTGAVERFRRNADGVTYTSEDSRSRFVKNMSDNTYILTTKDQYSYGFDVTSGWLRWMKDRNGNEINITVDSDGKVTKVTDTVAREYIINYRTDKPSLIDNIVDIENRVVRYEYDADNRLSSVTDPVGGKMYYEYDGSGFLNKIKDHNGVIVESITYNHTEGENQHKVSQATDSLGCVVNYSYDMLNKKTTITDMNNRVSTYWFDSSMYSIKVQDPDGRYTLTEYYIYGGKNKYGDIRSFTDRNGNRTEYNIDSIGNVIKKINCTDNSSSEYEYDDKNNLIWEKDECGICTYYIFDEDKINLMKRVQPLNGTDSYVDGQSNTDSYAIEKYTYYTRDEAQLMFNCDVAGLLKSKTDPENKTVTYTYDRDGSIKTIIDAQNNVVTFEYNRISWKTAEISAKGYRTEYTYDGNGQLEKAVNTTGGNTTRIVYNLLGQKIQEIRPGQYNAEDDLIAQHRYNNLSAGYRYEYHDSGKLKKVTDPEGYATSYEYDCNGNLIKEIRHDGSIYKHYYDVMDRPVKTDFMEDENAGEEILAETVYAVLDDGKSQKTEKRYLNDAEIAEISYISDYAGRLIEQQNPDGTKTKHGYNMNGTIAAITNQDGSTIHYRYDGLGRLSEQWTPLEIVNGSMSYTYTKNEYYKNGRKKRESVGKGKVSLYQPAANMITQEYAYYNNGWVKTVTDDENRKTEYIYDSDGNIIKEEVYTDASNKLTTEYVYNHLGKMQEMKHHIRAGDIFGNTYSDSSDTILTTTYTYDPDGNIKTIIAPDQITTTYHYDNLGRLLKTSMPGRDEYGNDTIIETTTEYDYEGKPINVTDANGNMTAYEYNKRGFLTGVIDALNGVTSYGYDRAGRKIIEVSPENYNPAKELNQMNRAEYAYDIMDRLKVKQDIYIDTVTNQWVTACSKAYKYDNRGNVIKELDALGYEAGTGTTVDERIDTGYGTEYTYNCADKAVTVIDPVSKQRALPYAVKYGYDAIGRKASEINANGVITLYTYDNAGNVLDIKIKKNQDAPEQSITSATYDLAGRQTSETDGNGNTVAFRCNSFGKLSSAEYPGDETIDSNTITYQYDTVGNLKKQEDSMGKVILYTYDIRGRNLSQTQQKSDGTQSITISFGYDKNGNKRFETDAEGNATEYAYDAMNRLIETKVSVSGTVQTTSYDYDANGNQTATTDWRGNTYTNVYDPLNRIIQKSDPYGIIQRLEYYKNSLQSKSYDALGSCTTFSYDRNGRLVSTIDSEGHVTSQAYDDAGNVQTKTDGRNISTTYKYDEFNRLKSVINAKGEVTDYTYDLNGNMLTQTDGNGNTTMFEYNVANKLIRKIDANGSGNPGKTESYTYYADGSMKAKTDRNGKTTNYSYDIHGRLLEQEIDGDSISYTYDRNGNQLTITDSTGTTERTYDELNRVLTKKVPNIGMMIFEYDNTAGIEAGCMAERSTDPKGNVTLKIFDRAGRLSKVTADGATTEYTYYPIGSRQSVIYPNGAREEYTYFSDGLLRELKNIKGDGSVMDIYTYTYDGAHNQLTKHEIVNGADKGTTSYTYDSLNRLETVTEPGRTTSYTYDRAGNRLSETVTAGEETVYTAYTYNEQNRLLKTVTQSSSEIERIVYKYDNNGNMLSKARAVSQSVPSGDDSGISGYVTGTISGQSMENYGTIYGYDVWNQLIKTIEKEKTVEYAYNGEGYMVEKSVNGSLTRLLYESDKVVLETDGAGTQTARNIYGLNLLARTMDSDTAYYMYNGHADVTVLMDIDGQILASYRYDAWGNAIEKSEAPEVDNPYRYAGYRYEEETDLYYLNARYYDSKIARFLTEDTYRGNLGDPLSLNLYTYCHNEPVMYWDPTGHWEVGDEKLNDEAKARIIALTNAYYEAKTKSEKDAIHQQANSIRNDKTSYQPKVTPLKTEAHEAISTAVKRAVASGGYLSKDEWVTAINSDGIKYTTNVKAINSDRTLKESNTVTSIGRTDIGVRVRSNLVKETASASVSMTYNLTRTESLFVNQLLNNDASLELSICLLDTLEKNKGKISKSETEKLYGDKVWKHTSAILERIYHSSMNDYTINELDYMMRKENISQAYNLLAFQAVCSASNANINIGPSDAGYYYVNGLKVYYESPSGYLFESGAKFSPHGSYINIAANGYSIINQGTSKSVPDKAQDIVNQVKVKNGAPPQGYKGGKTYNNQPVNGGQKLPDGVKYKEYDVNPYVKGQNRGAERVVIGDDGSAWYTNDHYHTFTKIK